MNSWLPVNVSFYTGLAIEAMQQKVNEEEKVNIFDDPYLQSNTLTEQDYQEIENFFMNNQNENAENQYEKDLLDLEQQVEAIAELVQNGSTDRLRSTVVDKLIDNICLFETLPGVNEKLTERSKDLRNKLEKFKLELNS